MNWTPRRRLWWVSGFCRAVERCSAERRESASLQRGSWGRQKGVGYFKGRKEVKGAESSRCGDFGGCATIGRKEKTQDTQTGWWEIRFDMPFSAFPGCESGVTGNVTSISIVFDEGTDVGPGNVVIDNIRITNEVVGEPRGGR